MRVCIVGGIFEKPAGYRASHSISPETVLARGLEERGIDVTVSGHRGLSPGRFDIVHVHHFGRAALRMAGTDAHSRFVFTTHDPFSMNGLSVSLKRRITDPLVLRRADRVVALSLRERDHIASRYSLHPDRIEVIPNGIDSSVFFASSGHVRDDHTLLFVGQLREFKGLDILLPAFAELLRVHPAARLVLAYQVDQCLARYRGLARRLGVASRVEFAGPKTPHELRALYQSAALVVVPSLGECLSTVVLEAMSCAATVVATDVGGIREQLDSSTGVIVPPGDAAALAAAMIRLLGDPGLRARLGSAAQARATACFSAASMIARHIDLYRDLLGQQQRSPAGPGERVLHFGIKSALKFT